MDITIKRIGQSVNGETVYRVYPMNSHLDIGDVIRRSGRRWCAWPAVRGEMRPRSAVTHHETRREAIARLIAHVDDASL